MKKCEVLAAIYVDEIVKGETKRVLKQAGDIVELPDDVADKHGALGYVDIFEHDGKPVVWGACCGRKE